VTEPQEYRLLFVLLLWIPLYLISELNIDYCSYCYYGFLYILYLNSFARKVLEDMQWLSPKNIAWALNALTGRPGYQVLFESAAARLCEVPSDDPQWSIQSAALISNALSHGSDGIFFFNIVHIMFFINRCNCV
jgi:hypothetical protein